jgi:hypothetical protein
MSKGVPFNVIPDAHACRDIGDVGVVCTVETACGPVNTISAQRRNPVSFESPDGH